MIIDGMKLLPVELTEKYGLDLTTHCIGASIINGVPLYRVPIGEFKKDAEMYICECDGEGEPLADDRLFVIFNTITGRRTMYITKEAMIDQDRELFILGLLAFLN
jgi:hypothetical protein